MPAVFVYGSLMMPSKGFAQGLAATLDDYEVRFIAKGVPYLEPSFAALTERVGARAEGVLYRIEETVYQRMLTQEHGYDAESVEVRVGDETVRATTLVLQPRYHLAREKTPSLRYLRLLINGAAHHHLPISYQQTLVARSESASRLSTKLAFLKAPVVWLTPFVGFPLATLIIFLALLSPLWLFLAFR